MVRITIKPPVRALNGGGQSPAEPTRKRTREDSQPNGSRGRSAGKKETFGRKESDREASNNGPERPQKRLKTSDSDQESASSKANKSDMSATSSPSSSSDSNGTGTRSSQTKLMLRLTKPQTQAQKQVKGGKNDLSKRAPTKVRFRSQNSSNDKINGVTNKEIRRKTGGSNGGSSLSNKNLNQGGARQQAKPSRNVDKDVCVVCESGRWHDRNKIVFCDGCNGAYHILCHEPPIPPETIEVADEYWYCWKCTLKRQKQLGAFRATPILSGMTGEKLRTEDKRFYLELLPGSKLVDLLLYCEELHPDLPIYSPKTEKIIASIRKATIDPKERADQEHGQDQELEKGSEHQTMPEPELKSNPNPDPGLDPWESMRVLRPPSSEPVPLMKKEPSKGLSHWWHPRFGKEDGTQPGVKMDTTPGVKYTTTPGKRLE